MTESVITTKSTEILSQIVTFTKYSKYIPEIGRRETWEELVERNMAMHINKYPKEKEKAVPSWRQHRRLGRRSEDSV